MATGQQPNLIFCKERLRLDGRVANSAGRFSVTLLYPGGLQLLNGCPRSGAGDFPIILPIRLAATCSFVFLCAPEEQVLILEP